MTEVEARRLRLLIDRLDLADGAEAPGRKAALTERVVSAGLSFDDPRLADAKRILEGFEENAPLDEAMMFALLGPRLALFERLILGELVIPEFSTFTQDLRHIFDLTRPLEEGTVATYIPQLARVSPKHWGASVCTVDGQRWSAGDVDVPFTVQSCMKPVNYCIALEEHGEGAVHRIVGREPSGRGFNELTLNKENRPHNPMINAGAIATSSLIQPTSTIADRFEHVMAQWARLSGGQRAGFSNAVYLSEKEKGDRNYALGYFMKEKKVFPEGTDLLATLEFYFQCCSIESSCERMAVVAATLANGGTCPTTGEHVLGSSTVRACLSLMSSCGMYDFSGEFAFTIGLPAKSGVSGALMVVIPNVLGLCTWSPRLDAFGNSVRGIAFCEELVRRFNVHVYDGVGSPNKRDPRARRVFAPGA